MSAPRWLLSVGSVVGGFVATVVLSTAADAAMVAAGVFPPAGGTMSDGMFLLAAAYRLAFTAVGGYVTARLAPDRPMRHAMVLAGIGVLAGLAGLVAFYKIGGPAMGPGLVRDPDPADGGPGSLGGRPAGDAGAAADQWLKASCSGDARDRAEPVSGVMPGLAGRTAGVWTSQARPSAARTWINRKPGSN